MSDGMLKKYYQFELGQVCSRLSSGKGIAAKEISEHGGYPVFGGNGLRGYSDRKNFEGQCAIIGRQGAFCGNVRFFSGEAYMTEHAVVVCANEKSDIKYLSYLLGTLNLGRLSGQSAQPGLSVKTLSKQVIQLPDISKQRQIAKVLSAFDEKIELNTQINHNLEKQAKAIFKSWFIDAPECKAWDSVPLKELVVAMRNGDWGKDNPCGNNTEVSYCIRGADIPDVNAGNKGKMPIRYILPKNYEKKHLVEGDIVVEISGGSPTQSTGRCAVISQALLDRYEQKIVCTNFCKALKPLDGYSHFLYYYWTYLYEKGCFFAYENGTTGIKNLDIAGIIENEFLQLPPIEIMEKFNELCDKLASTIFSNGTETERLAQLRDALLPKLMSGEINVSEVEI